MWTDYLTLDVVTAWMGETPDAAGNLQLVVSMACDWVQSFLSRPVAPTTFARRFDGPDSAHIMLPYSPVVSVTSVTEYLGASGARVLAQSTPATPVDGYQVEPLTGRLTRVSAALATRPWMPGARNIEVVWIAGYATTPPRIVMATLELIKHWWINTQENTEVGPSVGGEDYGASTPGGLWAGVPYRVESMLAQSRQVNIG